MFRQRCALSWTCVVLFAFSSLDLCVRKGKKKKKKTSLWHYAFIICIGLQVKSVDNNKSAPIRELFELLLELLQRLVQCVELLLHLVYLLRDNQ
jgi:uncharacterized membrane protein